MMKRDCCIKQRDLSDCGAACLASVCAHHGLFVPVSRIRQWADTGHHGTSIYGLIQAAQQLNMDATAVRMQWESLHKIPLPSVAHVVLENEVRHFVVVVSVTEKDVVIMDPAVGRYVKISREEFEKLWTDVILTLTPGKDFRTNKKKKNWYKISDIIKPDRYTLVFALTGAVIFSVSGLGTTIYLREIVDVVLENKNTAVLFVFSAVMIGVLALQSAAGLVKDFLVLKASQALDSRLILGYYRHLLHLPQTFFDRMRTGEIVSRINDAVRINVFVNEVAINIVVDILVCLVSVMLMFIYYWKLAILMLVFLPACCGLLYLSNRVNSRWQRRIMEAGAQLDGELVHTLGASATVKRLALEEHVLEKVRVKFDRMLTMNRRSAARHIGINASAGLITRMFTIIILWTGCYYILSGHLTKGELLSFYALITYFTLPVLNLLSANKQVREAMTAAERLFEIMDLDPEEKNIQHEDKDIRPGTIEFKDVSFRYGNGELVLKDVNMKIMKGSITGLQGESGSGKSTLLALLQKIYGQASGSITINDVDIRRISNRQLRNMIAAVPQQTELFNCTIRENIILDKERDEEKLLEISERCGVLDLVKSLPDGFDTVIHEQSSNLSGGQKQKISFARALYRNSPVLILDEPTASLDMESADKIMQTIEWYNSKGNTVIIIAHEASALRFCNNIAILKNGRIA